MVPCTQLSPLASIPHIYFSHELNDVTGFCGSLTTFSGWQYDIFTSWINSGQHHRGGFRDVRGCARAALYLG
jgi:hypothetical protein